MRNTLARRFLLAGTFTFVLGCGHDSAVVPTEAASGADNLTAAPALFNSPSKVVISPTSIPALIVGATVQLAAIVTNPIGTQVNAPVVWTSSNTGVATIAANGLVAAKAGGKVVIRAVAEGALAVGDSMVIVVNGVASAPAASRTVTVVLSASSIAPTKTTQATATVSDSNGKVLTGRPIIWMSLSPTIATVNSSTGLVTAVARGTSTITATNGSFSGGATVTVAAATAPVPATVKSITVALSNSSIATGMSSQATATLKDSLGQVITGRTVTWTSANPAIASVDGTSGIVSGAASGSTTITATNGSVKGSAAITVTAPAAIVPSGSETVANLPQVYLNTVMPAAPAAGGKIISVAAGGNFQAALNNAQPGDVIELANGATFTGNFTLPNKNTTSTKWIVIRPASMSGVPAEGRRMTPALAASARIPKVLSASNQGAISTDFGAHHYRFVGIEVSVPASIGNTGLIRLGTSYEATVAQLPHNLVLDRMYIHGTPTGNNRRCVTLNGASSAVIDSYISDCHEAGVDAQAIAGWSGPGPFKIVNNYLEASSENISWGGGDPLIQGMIPSDIEIRRNHITKPVSWKGGPWLIKNLFEIKNAQRVLVEGNVFENNWAHAQGGSAINLKSTNQDGRCGWCVTKDITFRYNIIKNTGSGFNLSGHDAQTAALPVPMTRVTITHNIVTGINVGPTFNGDGRGFMINSDPIDLVIAHNTVLDPTNMAIAFGGPSNNLPTRLVFRDNIVGGGQYGVKGPGLSAAATLATFMPTGGFRGNVLILAAGNTIGYPASTYFASTMAAVGFTNSSALDFRLIASSPFRLRASDGRDPGADITALNAAIAGVVIP